VTTLDDRCKIVNATQEAADLIPPHAKHVTTDSFATRLYGKERGVAGAHCGLDQFVVISPQSATPEWRGLLRLKLTPA